MPGYPRFRTCMSGRFKADLFLVHPKFAIPVHGEFRHRMAQKELAEYMGVQKENALLVNSGDVVSLDEDSCQVTDHESLRCYPG